MLRELIAISSLGLVLTTASGCNSVAQASRPVQSGQYGDARLALQETLDRTSKTSRDYHLNRIRLAMVNLADGLPALDQDVFTESFEFLRRQGVNKDQTVNSVVLNEDLKLWKGEPFEQALSFHYIACSYAMQGQWDNARAAAQNSLFLLKNFGDNEEGDHLSTEEIARRAAEADAADGDDGEDYLDNGYVAVETNFSLGYLMNGIANHALGRTDEADDNFRKAVTHNSNLQVVVDRVKAGANTILVVDFGLGPRKVGYGPDDSLGRFDPVIPSRPRELKVAVNGSAAGSCRAACDVNEMARDHMWNNLEDVRLAKSLFGDIAIGVGAGVALSGSGSRDSKRAGAALVLAGLIAKAGAHVDYRYCDIMPQSVFVAAIDVNEPSSTIRVQVGEDPSSVMVLPDVDPPGFNQSLQLRYVRTNFDEPAPPGWAVSGRVEYANDYCDRRIPGDTLPYILGGTCVRTPSEETLARYQQAGNLLDFSVSDLKNLYAQENIALEPAETGYAGKHVLEGGTSLACPLPGSAGYARLFDQVHSRYRPRSNEVKQLMARCTNPDAH